MAFFKKRKDSSGRQFYVEFLGWLPCRGIRGNIYTNSVAHELIQRKRKYPDVPKMTLQVTLNEIKISNDNSEEHRKEKITSVKYPCIMMKNIMYATCMTAQNADIAACIYYTFNPATKSMLHTHVYRFDSPATASTFVDLINQVILTPQHQDYVSQIEEQLRHNGLLQAVVDRPPPQPAFPQKPSWSPTSETFPDQVADYESDTYSSPEALSMQAVTSELKQKLRTGEGPLLLPPKDYDTVHRKQGRLNDITMRKSLNEILVGRTAVEAAASISGNTSLLNDEEEEQDENPNDKPIYYPPKQPSDHDMMYPKTSVGSPPVMRRENLYRRNRESIDSSGGSRASYTAPGQSSPTLATKRGNMSAYENFPTLKGPDRIPVAASSPDMFKRNSSHHMRESSMSSSHSGVSSHSDHSQHLSQIVNEENLEIPPDYDQDTYRVNPIDQRHKDRNSGYGLARSIDNLNFYDPHYSQGHQGPSMGNVYPQYSPTYAHYPPNTSELQSKPVKRISPVHR